MAKQINNFEVALAKSKILDSQTCVQLNSVGVDSLGKLKEIGWEQACIDLALEYPTKATIRDFFSIYRVFSDNGASSLTEELKNKISSLLESLKL